MKSWSRRSVSAKESSGSSTLGSTSTPYLGSRVSGLGRIKESGLSWILRELLPIS